jgi:hypothetical protein
LGNGGEERGGVRMRVQELGFRMRVQGSGIRVQKF